MTRIWKLALVVALFSLMAMGCSDRSESLTQSMSDRTPSLLAAISIPGGSTLVSATLSVYVRTPGFTPVNVHRITNPWGEMTVTYGNFSNAYDATVLGSFTSDGIGWRSVDVTATVQDWIDGTYENYGFVLEQGPVEATTYHSSEGIVVGERPRLEICYMTSTGPQCVVIQRDVFGEVADSHVWEIDPLGNYGSDPILYTGLINRGEKYALLRFDMEDRPPQPASLGDFVWYDVNDNGIQDAGETGVPDVTVSLMDCNGRVLASTITDANGYYLFSNLTPGDYNVHFVAPLGYVFSPRNVGDDALDSDVNPADGLTECTTLGSGENDMTWDAGLFLPPPPEGCSLTIGYWKTHAGFGPQPDHLTQFLPIWLGTAGGSRSINVSNVQIAYDILVMKTYGVPSNGITKLYAQMLAAKLNIANGASGSAVASTISAANGWLANHSWTEWSSLSKNTQKQVLGWMTTFDKYNNGLIGPGHCDIIGDGNDI